VNRISTVFVAAAGVAASSIVLAPAAAAGCMVNLLGAQYCDAAPNPDGTWQRCWQTGQQFYPTFGGGGYQTGFGSVPAMGNCYQVDPKVPWPVTPIGQPQYYIQ
jgi:Flp pilus assembly protein TadG